jgi:hypothetical protein
MMKHGENMKLVDASTAQEEVLQVGLRHQGTSNLLFQSRPLEC